MQCAFALDGEAQHNNDRNDHTCDGVESAKIKHRSEYNFAKGKRSIEQMMQRIGPNHDVDDRRDDKKCPKSLS